MVLFNYTIGIDTVNIDTVDIDTVGIDILNSIFPAILTHYW